MSSPSVIRQKGLANVSGTVIGRLEKGHRQVEEAEISRIWRNLLIADLDLLVNSFLFQQVMRYYDKKKMQPLLSNDKKFVTAIQNMGKGFQRCYEKLFP